MSDTKWTPGPWVAEGSCVIDAEDYVVTTFVNGSVLRGSPEEDYATASLVAAAPDLYEALRPFVEMRMGDPESLQNARKAMAKARGEHND